MTSRRSATGASRGAGAPAPPVEWRAAVAAEPFVGRVLGAARRATRAERRAAVAAERFSAGFSLPQAAQVMSLSLNQPSRIASIARTSAGRRGRSPRRQHERHKSKGGVAGANRADPRSRWRQARTMTRATLAAVLADLTIWRQPPRSE